MDWIGWAIGIIGILVTVIGGLLGVIWGSLQEKINGIKEFSEKMIAHLDVRGLAKTVDEHKSKLNDLRGDHDVLQALVDAHEKEDERRYEGILRRMDTIDNKLDLLLDRRSNERKN